MMKIPKLQRKHVGLLWMVFALVFCTSVGSSVEDKQLIRGLLSGFNLVSVSESSDDYLVEVLTINCRLELIHVKHIYEDFSLAIPDVLGKTIRIHHDQALREDYIQKALRRLDPRIKQNLYRCLRKNYFISPVSGEDDRPAGLFQNLLGSLLPMSNPIADSRRLLADEASSPAPSPKSSRSKSPKKQKAPPPVDTFVIPIPFPKSPPSFEKDTADTGSDSHSGGHTTIIVAVVVTAVVTFLVALILFCCCRKAFGGGSGFEHKDDRPLLSLSMSDSSRIGSSPTAWGYKSSVNEEKISNQPFNLGSQVGAGDSGGKLSSGTANTASAHSSSFKNSTESSSAFGINASISALKPPPGKTGASGPGLSNLKPPPGRAEPLPPEPPASSRPSPGMGGPPPPPPKAPAAPHPPPKAPAAPPPPPPKKGGPPPPGPPPPPGGKPGRAPPRPPIAVGKAGSSSTDADANAKAKLKPFFWDKVMANNSDHSMVWDQIKSGSFQFNEEMIESLFGYAAVENKNEKKKDPSSRDQPPQFIQLIDQKKAQNLSILLRAMNVTTEEVRDALEEGNELPAELLETLLKMAPTVEEELKLRLFDGDITKLGPADRFLKVMVDIPFAFKRIEVLLFMSTLQEEATSVKENVATLEEACKELRNSRLFLKLLEAVLKTGNRMNDGTYRGGAQAFRLDTLLKLADVKGTDGKTTLLHFVVQEIIRSEGVRAVRAARESKSMSSIKSDDLLEDVPDDSEEHYRDLGLQVVSGLGDQLQNVRKAASIDSESLTGTIAKLGNGLLKAKNFVNKDIDEVQEDMGFHKALKSFVEHAEADVMKLLEEEKRIMALVKSTADYFHGNSGKEEGLRLFIIIRDFLIMLERVCREVKAKPKWPTKTQKTEPVSRQTSKETPRTPMTPDFRQKVFPAIAERQMDGTSSDDD